MLTTKKISLEDTYSLSLTHAHTSNKKGLKLRKYKEIKETQRKAGREEKNSEIVLSHPEKKKKKNKMAIGPSI